MVDCQIVGARLDDHAPHDVDVRIIGRDHGTVDEQLEQGLVARRVIQVGQHARCNKRRVRLLKVVLSADFQFNEHNPVSLRVFAYEINRRAYAQTKIVEIVLKLAYNRNERTLVEFGNQTRHVVRTVNAVLGSPRLTSRVDVARELLVHVAAARRPVMRSAQPRRNLLRCKLPRSVVRLVVAIIRIATAPQNVAHTNERRFAFRWIRVGPDADAVLELEAAFGRRESNAMPAFRRKHALDVFFVFSSESLFFLGDAQSL